jgi:hypothetical protein
MNYRRKCADSRRNKMKYMKILGLAAMALAALMAMVGTASATTLTSPKGTTYTSTIKAENSGAVSLTSAFGGFGTVTCNKSLVEGKIEQHGAGVTASGNISKLTFEECNNPTTIVSNGALDLHFVNSKEGTLTGTNTTILIHTAIGTCHFQTTNTGTHLGTLTLTEATGGNAVLDIKATIPSPTGCGNGTWEGSYKVVTPTTLYADA